MMMLVDCAAACFGTELPDPEFPDGDDTVDAVAWSMTAILQATVSKLRTVTTQKIGKRDGIGVILYNTKYRTPMKFEEDEEEQKDANGEDDDEEEEEEDQDGYVFGNTGLKTTAFHQLLPLERPGVSTVQRLKSTQEDTFTGDCELNLKEEFCATEEDEGCANPPIQLALEAAVQAFSQASCVKQRPAKKEVPDKKQIWIFSSQDNPIVEEDVRRILKESASNAHDNKIEVLVWPVVKDPESFDADEFYGQVLSAEAPCEDDNSCAEFVSTVEVISKRTRRAFALPLLFPNWRETPDKPNITLGKCGVSQSDT